MTRIGFAYNQKPAASEIPELEPSDESRDDDKPPSTRRDSQSRNSLSSASANSDAGLATPVTSRSLALRDAKGHGINSDDRFAEWDGPETIDAVAAALSALGKVIRLEADDDFPAKLRAARPDIVFNIAEGLTGVNREAHVPAICEFFGIPYSGSDPFTLSLCLDKGRTKETLAFHGVPTAPFAVATTIDDLRAIARGETRLPVPSARTPLFIKPVHEGSSKGITERNYVTSTKALLATGEMLLETYDQPLLAETFLPGAEFTCGVLGNGSDAVVLPIVGINFGSLPDEAVPIYGFEAKWIWDRPENPLHIFECPARVPEALRAGIEDVVLRAYRVLGCRDWSRVDVRLDAAGVPNLVEVNPLPGILPDPADNSCLPKAARAAGLSYDELIQSCLVHAATRQGVEVITSEARDPLLARRKASKNRPLASLVVDSFR
jgi:D-alanine-D-alanine ligase